MKMFENTIWGSVKMPESFSELLNCVLGTGNDVSYWRGQSDIAWKLDSSIARKAIRNNDVFTLKQNNFSSIDFWEKLCLRKQNRAYIIMIQMAGNLVILNCWQNCNIWVLARDYLILARIYL